MPYYLLLCLALLVTAPQVARATPDADAPAADPVPMQDAWWDAREAFWQRTERAEDKLTDIVASPTAPDKMRRLASHLLARWIRDHGEPGDAVNAWRQALELERGAPSALKDHLQFGLAESLIRAGERSDEALDLLNKVSANPQSDLHRQATLLQADYFLSLGREADALKQYDAFLKAWPTAPESTRLRERIRRGGNDDLTLLPSPPPYWLSPFFASSDSATPLDAGRVPLETIQGWLTERRFDGLPQALAPWLVEPPPKGPKAEREAWLDALELALQYQWENFHYDEALATSRRLQKHKRPGLSKDQKLQLHALHGEFESARKKLRSKHKGRAYLIALGDLAYRYGRYEEAFKAYRRANGTKKPPTERMIGCMLRMGDADAAITALDRHLKSVPAAERIKWRYWRARAEQLAGKDPIPHFEKIVADAPLSYYGHLAASRLQELQHLSPEGAPLPTSDVLRKGKETPSLKGAIAWTEASLEGAFDAAPQPESRPEIEAKARHFAKTWGALFYEADRAAEWAELGDLTATLDTLRLIDMDLRAARRLRASGIQERAASPLLDNRRQARTPGGGPMVLRGQTRKTKDQAQKVKQSRPKIQADLRVVQQALADPYATRRKVFEDGWRLSPETLEARGRDLYPIAYPEIVSAVSRQFGLPPYYVYAVMTVESAFHPGAVSPANAYGLVQVIPRTGEHLARELGFQDFSPERLLDPTVSIYFGGYYLARLLSRFHGQEPLAAAAYNAGPHRVATWLMARGTLPLDMFVEDIPFTQARRYTKRIIEYVGAYRRVYHDEPFIYVTNIIDPSLGEGPNY